MGAPAAERPADAMGAPAAERPAADGAHSAAAGSAEKLLRSARAQQRAAAAAGGGGADPAAAPAPEAPPHHVPAVPDPVAPAAPALHVAADIPTRLAAGWVSGALGELLMHPLSTVEAHVECAVARKLLRPSLRGLVFEPKGAAAGEGGRMAQLLDAGGVIVQRHGWQGLYRGAAAPVIAGSFAGSAAFTTYGEARRALRDGAGLGARSSACLAGAASGLMTASALAPLEVVTVRLQLGASASSSLAQSVWTERLTARLIVLCHGEPMVPVEEVLRRSGWRGLWTAAGPTAAREVSFYSLYYVAYEEVKGAMMRRFQMPEVPAILLGGAASGIVGAVCAHPMTTVVRLQHEDLERMLRGKERRHLSGTLGLLWHQLQEKGLWRLATGGLGATLLRAAPLNAGVFLAYEGLVEWAATRRGAHAG